MAFRFHVSAGPVELPLACDPSYPHLSPAERARYAVEGDPAILGTPSAPPTLWRLRPLDLIEHAEAQEAAAPLPVEVLEALRALPAGDGGGRSEQAARLLLGHTYAFRRRGLSEGIEMVSRSLVWASGVGDLDREGAALLLRRLTPPDLAAAVIEELCAHVSRVSGWSRADGEADPKASSGA